MSTLAASYFPQPHPQFAFPPAPMWDIPFFWDAGNAQGSCGPQVVPTTDTAGQFAAADYQSSRCPSTVLPMASPPSAWQCPTAPKPTAPCTPNPVSPSQHASQSPLPRSPETPAMQTGKRRRGRPRKNLSLSDDGDSTSPNATAADRHERRRVLERNRIAATKCRNRKRDEVKELEAQEHEAGERHRHLSALVAQLRTDLVDLKTQLLQHTDCKCVVIQKYIAHHAEKAVGELLESPTHSMDRRSSTSLSASDSLGDVDGLQTPWYEALPSPTPQMQSSGPGLDPFAHVSAAMPAQSHMVQTPPLNLPDEQHHLQPSVMGLIPMDHVMPQQPLPMQQHIFWAS